MCAHSVPKRVESRPRGHPAEAGETVEESHFAPPPSTARHPSSNEWGVGYRLARNVHTPYCLIARARIDSVFWTIGPPHPRERPRDTGPR
jgi:hypothetical protein